MIEKVYGSSVPDPEVGFYLIVAKTEFQLEIRLSMATWSFTTCPSIKKKELGTIHSLMEPLLTTLRKYIFFFANPKCWRLRKMELELTRRQITSALLPVLLCKRPLLEKVLFLRSLFLFICLAVYHIYTKILFRIYSKLNKYFLYLSHLFRREKLKPAILAAGRELE